MNEISVARLSGFATSLLAASALAAGSGMPGDAGKPGGADGIPPVNPTPRPASATPAKVARAPDIALALKAAQTIAKECSRYPLGVAVVNAEGAPILVYIPDGSRASHAYTAIRKAYSAVTYKAPTSQFIARAQQDPAVAAQVKADPNLVAYGGGIPLKVGDEIVGAIGVSGAEPGAHDEECGLKGVEAIRDSLK